MKEARRRALEAPLAAFDRKRRANALRRFITTWARAATQEKGLRRLQARAFRGKARRYDPARGGAAPSRTRWRTWTEGAGGAGAASGPSRKMRARPRPRGPRARRH